MLWTGIPHMRNVGIAGYMAGGSALIKDAMKFHKDGVPDHLMKMLEEGGLAHFGGGGKMAPLLKKWDDSVRAARLQQLLKDPKFKDQPLGVLLDRVNDDIGAYSKRTGMTMTSTSIGGQFPQWHGYIVPTMAARAYLRNPGRMARMARAEHNINEQIPGGERFELGGPQSEAGTALFNPLKYFTSPSMVGPAFGSGGVVEAAQAVPKLARGDPRAVMGALMAIPQFAAESWGPSAAVLGMARDWQYGSPAWWLSPTGLGFQKKKAHEGSATWERAQQAFAPAPATGSDTLIYKPPTM